MLNFDLITPSNSKSILAANEKFAGRARVDGIFRLIDQEGNKATNSCDEKQSHTQNPSHRAIFIFYGR